MTTLRIHLIAFVLMFVAIESMENVPTKKLSSNYNMPVIGLGTWTLEKSVLELSVMTALDNGYRHIDTAVAYNNQPIIGKILKKWFDEGGRREDLFITTKLSPWDNRPSDVHKAVKQALKELGINYIDMFLIHVPVAFKGIAFQSYNKDGTVILDTEADFVETWKEMENQVKAGLVRSIGLSNFNESQILRILNEAEVQPSNLQVEFHPYNQQKSLRKFCAKHNMILTAYSPLGGSFQTKKILSEPIIQSLAKKYNKTPAQIVLRFIYQNDAAIIPRSSKQKHLRENIDIFDFQLNDEEMQDLTTLDKGEEGRVYNFLDMLPGVENHPEYPFANQIYLRNKTSNNFYEEHNESKNEC